MRLPRARFTLRELMVAVAMVAVALTWMVHPGIPQAVKATSSDPKLATRQEKALHGVLWGMSYEQARESARREGRPILIFFSGVNDANGRMMEQVVLPRADVVPLLSRFVTVQLYTDYQPILSLKIDQRVMIADHHQELELTLVNDAIAPEFVVVDAFGHVVASQDGVRRPSEFIGFLKSAESAYRRRSGADRLRSGHVWTFGSILVAIPSFVGIWALLRLKRKVYRER